MNTPFSTIEETATAYIEEIRLIQPSGPYVIVGYCAGGIIAFEIAKQLQDVEAEVRDLILIDTFRPGVSYALPSFGKRVLRAAKTQGAGQFFKHSFTRLHQISENKAYQKKVSKCLKEGVSVPYELRTHWLTMTFLQSVAKYELPHFDGELSVFAAADVHEDNTCSEPNLGWDGYATSITCTDIPGGHFTLTDEPNVKILAEKINTTLKNS